MYLNANAIQRTFYLNTYNKYLKQLKAGITNYLNLRTNQIKAYQ